MMSMSVLVKPKKQRQIHKSSNATASSGIVASRSLSSGIYIVSNQQTKTIAELWDGTNLMCDFRRIFTHDMMVQLPEILKIVGSLDLSQDEDQLVWQYETNDL